MSSSPRPCHSGLPVQTFPGTHGQWGRWLPSPLQTWRSNQANEVPDASRDTFCRSRTAVSNDGWRGRRCAGPTQGGWIGLVGRGFCRQPLRVMERNTPSRGIRDASFASQPHPWLPLHTTLEPPVPDLLNIWTACLPQPLGVHTDRHRLSNPPSSGACRPPLPCHWAPLSWPCGPLQ